MKRFLTILLILTFVLLSFSCKRKEGDEAETGTSAPAQTTASLPSSREEAASAPLTLSPYAEDVTDESGDFSSSFFYRGGEIFIKAEFNPVSATLVFNIGDDEIRSIISRYLFLHPGMGKIEYTLSSSTLTLSYERKTEDEVEAMWKEYKDFLNQYNSEKSTLAATSSDDELVITKEGDTVKGRVEAAIYSDRAVITVPETFSSDETASFLAYLREEYPIVLDYGTILASGSDLTLEYSSSFGNDDASMLFSALLPLIDEYFTLPPESSSSPLERRRESGGGADEDKTESAPSPLTGAGRSVKNFSLSLLLENSGDSVYGYVPSAYLKVDYAVKENFSIGVVAGYDFSGFVPVGVSARYYTQFLPSLYAEGTFGGKIGVGSNMNYGEWFSIVSLGYEYRLNDMFSLFASADFTYRWGRTTKGFRYGLSVGGRVSF